MLNDEAERTCAKAVERKLGRRRPGRHHSGLTQPQEREWTMLRAGIPWEYPSSYDQVGAGPVRQRGLVLRSRRELRGDETIFNNTLRKLEPDTLSSFRRYGSSSNSTSPVPQKACGSFLAPTLSAVRSITICCGLRRISGGFVFAARVKALQRIMYI